MQVSSPFDNSKQVSFALNGNLFHFLMFEGKIIVG